MTRTGFRSNGIPWVESIFPRATGSTGQSPGSVCRKVVGPPVVASGFSMVCVMSLFFETAKVLVIGVAVALLANQLSPKGLMLRRDYFKESTRPLARKSPSEPSSSHRVAELSNEQVWSLFQDPGYREGRIVFVDARKESFFLEGHIPDAYPLDRFYPEKDLPAVLVAGLPAERVVVYCAGGTCEDSHYAALQLIEAGLEPSRVQVYAGGITDWRSHSWPIERGVRGSGLIGNISP